MKSVIAATDPSRRAAWSAQITEHVTALAEWSASRTVLAFLPMDGEVDTTGMIKHALCDGKTVGVPRMHHRHIEFHGIPSVDGPWEVHPFGVREPPATLPVIDPCLADLRKTLVLTPGLCFDAGGGRLGFGKGYYDSLLERCRAEKESEIFFLAVCFSIQLIGKVPAGEHDRIVDAIVTERGIAFRREPARSRGPDSCNGTV